MYAFATVYITIHPKTFGLPLQANARFIFFYYGDVGCEGECCGLREGNKGSFESRNDGIECLVEVAHAMIGHPTWECITHRQTEISTPQSHTYGFWPNTTTLGYITDGILACKTAQEGAFADFSVPHCQQSKHEPLIRLGKSKQGRKRRGERVTKEFTRRIRV